MWKVYVLQCKDGSLYTGITTQVERRFEEHAAGKGGAYTRSHKPIRVVHVEAFDSRSEALRREAELKGWVRGKKIEELGLRF